MTGSDSSDNDDLRRSLSRLHTQLSGSPTLDGQSRQLLRDVLGDIERLLAAADPSPTAARDPLPPPPQSRLEALAATFDAGHPTLSASVRELVDLLGRAGL